MRADSTEYVGVPLTTIPAGVDLSLDTFDMAFAATKDSVIAAPDWHAATWDAAKQVVKLLVGPGAVVIAPGSWVVHVRVHDSPETPVIPASGKFVIEALV